MSNVYGFDFLNAQHKSTDNGSQSQPGAEQAQSQSPKAEEEPYDYKHDNRSDLEKQFDVIGFLRDHRSSGCLPPSIILKAKGVDLSEGGRDESVTKLLLKNPRIKVEEIPDPENPSLTFYTFGFNAKFNNVQNRTGLLAQINREKNGVQKKDLKDSYDGIEGDIDELITAGEIIAVMNTEDKENKILFPRGEQFLVELDGHVSVDDTPIEELAKKYIYTPHNAALTNPAADHATTAPPPGPSVEELEEAKRRAHLEKERKEYFAKTDVNPKKQIRRGEAVWVGGQWFRVSSAIREGSLADQPTRAQAPLSVTSRKELSKKNELQEGYIRDFDEKNIPLDHRLKRETIENIRAGKIAQAKLYKIAAVHGKKTGGAGSQLLSSNATAISPEALASAFASTASSVGVKRRAPRVHASSHMNANKNAEEIEAAKKAASDPALLFCHARRHGCSLDVRDLYLATKDSIPPPEKEGDIYNMMLEYNLLEKNEPWKRPRMSKENETLDEHGKPKKRRYYERKGQRMTNTHLVGTEIGQALAAAAEKQQRGKSVGDGGM